MPECQVGSAEYDGGAGDPVPRATVSAMTLPQRLLRVVPVVTVALVACWGATLNNDDFCRDMGECLSDAFDDLFVVALVVPAAAVIFRLLHLDRVLLHTATLTVFGGMLWYAAGELLRALDPSRSYEAPLPLAMVVGVALLAATAATLAVGPRESTWTRIGICVAVVAASVGASWAAGWAEQSHRNEEIMAAPVTLFAPVIAGESPRDGSASGAMSRSTTPSRSTGSTRISTCGWSRPRPGHCARNWSPMRSLAAPRRGP